MKTKICSMCQVEKSVDDFYFSIKRPTGSSRCKECSSEASSAHHKKHKDKHNKNARRYRTENRDAVNARKREQYRKDPRPSILLGAKVRSKINKIELTITIDDINIPEKCPILGIDLYVGDKTLCDNSPTLDRLDNNKGYIPGNVNVISLRANRLKNDGTAEEHEKIAKWMRENNADTPNLQESNHHKQDHKRRSRFVL